QVHRGLTGYALPFSDASNSAGRFCMNKLSHWLMAIAAIFAAASPALSATDQHQHDAPTAQASPEPLYTGLGDVHFPVTTTSPDAQKYFDQGLAFDYGFNHDEAYRSFATAGMLDPKMAMAPWGVALVLGPNYNLPGNPDAMKIAFESI